MKDFEMVPHTADIKIRAYGHTMEELFRHALQGMFQSIRPQAPGCHEHDGRLVCKIAGKAWHSYGARSGERFWLIFFLSFVFIRCA